MKPSFLLYADAYESIRPLTAEQKANLLDAIFLYNRSEEVPELDPVVNMAFSFLRRSFDRENEKYAKVCERNRKNGPLGGRPKNNPNEPKKPSGLLSNPKNPDGADTDPDPGIDPVPDPQDNQKKNTPPTPRKRGAKVGAVIYTESFEQFWSVYPLQKGKAKAFESWQAIPHKHPTVKVPQIMAAIQAQVTHPEHFRNLSGEFNPPHPATWLNQGRWDDVVKPQAALSTSGSSPGIAELLRRQQQEVQQ